MTGMIEHPEQYFHIQLRDDYLAVYEGLADILSHYKPEKSASSDCKAMIASILENWMESKSRKSSNENDWWVYFTIEEIEHQLRYRYKRNVIIQSLQEMTEEGYYVDEEGKTYTGTVKREPFIQNTYKYQLHLPVMKALIQSLPEQSPYNPKQRPNLGRPKKSSGEINSLKINGINSNGFSQENGTKINDISEYRLKKDGFTAKNGLKINAPFYTQITNIDLLDSQIVSGIFALAQMPSSWLVIQPFSIFNSEDWQVIEVVMKNENGSHSHSLSPSDTTTNRVAPASHGAIRSNLEDTEFDFEATQRRIPVVRPGENTTHSQTPSFPPTVELPRQGGRALSGDAPVSHSEGQAPTQDTGATVPPVCASVGTPSSVPPRGESHEGQGVPSPLQGMVNNPELNPNLSPPIPFKADTNGNLPAIGKDEKPKRGRRKPKPEADPAFQERIVKVFDAFDRLAQETSPGFTYSKTEEAKKAIATMLLDRNPTMVGLERLYHKLINEPRYANGFKWSEHMTIKAVCGQYGSNPGLHATVEVAANGPKLPPRMPTYEELANEEY